MPKKKIQANPVQIIAPVFELSDEAVKDILVIAAEGGINYWCIGMLHRYPRESRQFKVREQEPSEGDACKEFDITADTVKRGITAILTKPYKTDVRMVLEVLHMLVEDDAGVIDADGADAIIQMGCFGELVYG